MTQPITKVLIRFPEDLLNEVEEHRFENRIPSRHQAILDLIKKGLSKEDIE